MSIYNHFAYGLDLSKRLKLLQPKAEKAYYKAPNSDSLFSISERLSTINHPVLVAVDGRDADFEDNGTESLIKKPQFFFMLLLPARNDKPEDILTAQATAESNALQVQARMIHQYIANEAGLSGLLIDSFSIRSIGPLGENLYGVIMGFNLRHGIDYLVESAYWVEPTEAP